MTHAQARRIADLTAGYRRDKDFDVAGGNSGEIFIHIYNLYARIDQDGHGVITPEHRAALILDRF